MTSAWIPLYEQTDGLYMAPPLGPLLANVFMCSIEENLEQNFRGIIGGTSMTPWS